MFSTLVSFAFLYNHLWFQHFLSCRDSDEDDRIEKPASKTTAADLFGSDIDDDSDVEKPTETNATATQV